MKDYLTELNRTDELIPIDTGEKRVKLYNLIREDIKHEQNKGVIGYDNVTYEV